jgi:cytochrome c oxidase subunit 2
MGHGTLEWVYVGVVVAVLIYIGADAWNVETFLDHAPEDAQVVKVTANNGSGHLSMKMEGES